VVAQVIAREAENPRRQSTGKDLVLVHIAIHQTDIEAANIATEDTVCADYIMAFCDLTDSVVASKVTKLGLNVRNLGLGEC